HGKTRQFHKTLTDFFTFIDSIAGDWEYAYSTEKQEKKKTRPEASEKTQRVTFSTTPTAAELAVTGTATEYPRDRKQEETGANQERKKVLEVPGTKSSGGRVLEYKKVLQVRTGSPHVYLQQSSKAEIGDSNCGSVSNVKSSRWHSTLNQSTPIWWRIRPDGNGGS
ncbi:Uncharacterized protein APZ42_003660, partial [Daphnia magna]